MTKVLIIIIFSLLSVQCKRKERDTQELSKYKKVKQDSLIQKYVINCAKTYNYRYQMLEWQNCLDSGLKQDSTVAYLWQQKAMPYFKNRKYEVGMEYLNKAVRYNPQRWLSYRAFIKCIFVKSYKESIKDFELCIKMEGNTYVQDHTYNFYIALCYLQLNKYKKAEHLFEKEISNQEKKWREAHFLDLLYFYLLD